MKKVIGVLGVAVFAVAMFFSANTTNISSDLDLTSLISLNSANAECASGHSNVYICNAFDRCVYNDNPFYVGNCVDRY